MPVFLQFQFPLFVTEFQVKKAHSARTHAHFFFHAEREKESGEGGNRWHGEREIYPRTYNSAGTKRASAAFRALAPFYGPR
jgi:hypothetical protein